MKTFDRICHLVIIALAIIVVATLGTSSVKQGTDINQLEGRVRVLENAYLSIVSPEHPSESPYYKAINLQKLLNRKFDAEEVIAPLPNSPHK